MDSAAKTTQASATKSPLTSIAAYPDPAARRLRVYAFDPQASLELDTAVINDAVITLPWETPWEEKLTIGPCNDYLDVIDFDPTSALFYAPVDLNDPVLLAQNGLPPAEGRPQFHQQMVFAVAMKTIRHFERALGRPVMWSRHFAPGTHNNEYIQRLRIYPHALREANAYYSPEKTALLFGYFKKAGADRFADDGSWVFTCLSQDIIAHETAHAILHGMQQRSIESTNPDALAFHEAFADIVALFQHFTLTEAVEHELAASRGSLRANGLLTGLAQQFGHATGRRGALRFALEVLEGEAKAQEQSGVFAPAKKLAETREPHQRGGILVAAIFDAFVTIYERRIADLMRLAGRGSSMDGGELPAELVGRLAQEASKSADHVLRMCVRALDYVPPVDLHFGEYLRAIITADADLVADDVRGYRVAIAQAFRHRGIFVPGCISMAPDSLIWDKPEPIDTPGLLAADRTSGLFARLLPELKLGLTFPPPAEPESDEEGPRVNLREQAHAIIIHNQRQIHDWLNTPHKNDEEYERLFGVKMCADTPVRSVNFSSWRKNADGNPIPAVEVHSARIAHRSGPDGQELRQLIIQITQKRRGYFSRDMQTAADDGSLEQTNPEKWKAPDFWFRGGATVHTDLRDGRLRRVIRKRIDQDERLERERAFRTGEQDRFGAAPSQREPFAFMHRS